MPQLHNIFEKCLQGFNPTAEEKGLFYSLPHLEKNGISQVSKLPICLRILLESLLRNYNKLRDNGQKRQGFSMLIY